MKYEALSKEELDQLTARLIHQATAIARRLHLIIADTDVLDPTSSKKEKSDD